MAPGDLDSTRAVDRVQIHQTAQSLHALHSLLNSQSSALAALAQLRRKIGKQLSALGDIKHLPSTPANAIKTSATVWESLADADQRCARLWEKECDSLGSELSKWFRRVSKEEKAHDEVVAQSNTKIKKAGQTFEKQMKKPDITTAAADRAKYLAVLEDLGKTMKNATETHNTSQTMQHNTSLLSFAATTSRLTEAEWTRILDSLRSTCGLVGELSVGRAACEGGWEHAEGLHKLLDRGIGQLLDEPEVDTDPTLKFARPTLPTPRGTTSKAASPTLRPPLPIPVPRASRSLQASPVASPTPSPRSDASGRRLYMRNEIDEIEDEATTAAISRSLSARQDAQVDDERSPISTASSSDEHGRMDASERPDISGAPDRGANRTSMARAQLSSPHRMQSSPAIQDGAMMAPGGDLAADDHQQRFDARRNGTITWKPAPTFTDQDKTVLQRTSARAVEADNGLGRSDTANSGGSEHSYVARMRERYAQQEVEEARAPSSKQPVTAVSPRPTPPRSATLPVSLGSNAPSSPFRDRAESRGLGGIGRLADGSTTRDVLKGISPLMATAIVAKGPQDNAAQRSRVPQRVLPDLSEGSLALAQPDKELDYNPWDERRNHAHVRSAEAQRHLAPPSSSEMNPDGRNVDHSPACGCWTCSARHYATPTASPQPKAPSPTTSMDRADKGKDKRPGWVGKGLRRLSVPLLDVSMKINGERTNSGDESKQTASDARGRLKS